MLASARLLGTNCMMLPNFRLSSSRRGATDFCSTRKLIPLCLRKAAPLWRATWPKRCVKMMHAPSFCMSSALLAVLILFCSVVLFRGCFCCFLAFFLPFFFLFSCFLSFFLSYLLTYFLFLFVFPFLLTFFIFNFLSFSLTPFCLSRFLASIFVFLFFLHFFLSFFLSFFLACFVCLLVRACACGVHCFCEGKPTPTPIARRGIEGFDVSGRAAEGAARGTDREGG